MFSEGWTLRLGWQASGSCQGRSDRIVFDPGAAEYALQISEQGQKSGEVFYAIGTMM